MTPEQMARLMMLARRLNWDTADQADRDYLTHRAAIILHTPEWRDHMAKTEALGWKLGLEYAADVVQSSSWGGAGATVIANNLRTKAAVYAGWGHVNLPPIKANETDTRQRSGPIVSSATEGLGSTDPDVWGKALAGKTSRMAHVNGDHECAVGGTCPVCNPREEGER